MIAELNVTTLTADGIFAGSVSSPMQSQELLSN
jgi:hypothetical protein